jgi:hypothetical protein
VPDEQAVKSGCRSEAATHVVQLVVEFKAWMQQRELLTLLFRRLNSGFNDIFEI